MFVQIGTAISEKRETIDFRAIWWYVIYLVISPEPEVDTMIHLDLIDGPIVPFK